METIQINVTFYERIRCLSKTSSLPQQLYISSRAVYFPPLTCSQPTNTLTHSIFNLLVGPRLMVDIRNRSELGGFTSFTKNLEKLEIHTNSVSPG